MNKIEELKILKAMYIQDLEDVHVYESNPHMKELREFELGGRIAAITDAIEYLEKQNKSNKKVIIFLVIITIILSLIYLVV
jgi:hypothetical protein